MDGFQRRREQKRTNILEATLRLCMQHGVDTVSMTTIAKEANVSQVTIYNYFTNKENLIHEVLIYYVDLEWKEFEELHRSNLTFPEKIKQLMFNKGRAANHIHANFYQNFMKQYAVGIPHVEQIYTNKMLPAIIELFDEGKEQGYVDRKISNQAIMVYLQMLKEAMQNEGVYLATLPMIEELTMIIFYGLLGKRDD